MESRAHCFGPLLRMVVSYPPQRGVLNAFSGMRFLNPFVLLYMTRRKQLKKYERTKQSHQVSMVAQLALGNSRYNLFVCLLFLSWLQSRETLTRTSRVFFTCKKPRAALKANSGFLFLLFVDWL